MNVRMPRIPDKVWHRKPGDVVRLYCNGVLQRTVCIVINQNHSTTELFDCNDNKVFTTPCSVRCEYYPKAEIILGKSKHV